MNLILATLNVVMGLSRARKFYWMFIEAKLPEAIVPYCDSPLQNVSIAAKMAMTPLVDMLSSEVVQHFCMTESMMSTLKEMEITNYMMSKEFGSSCALLNLLVYISSLLSNDITASMTTSNPDSAVPLFRIISAALQLSEHHIPELEAAIFAVWKFVLANTPKTLISDQEQLVAQLLNITGSPIEELHSFTSCVLWRFEDGALEGT